jgi:type II secretory pathway component PulF
LVIFIIIQSQILPSYQQLFKQLNHPEFKTQSINLRQIIEWGLIAVISLLVPKKIRYQLPWIGPINKNLAWLTWLQLMSLSLASGSNIAQALSFTQNKILKLPMQYWHQRMIQDLQFGHFQFQFPDDLPKVCRHILNLSHLNIDLPPLFNQASLTLEQEIYAILQNLERYLQPLLLLIIAGVCAYLGMMIYSPLLDLGEFIF